MTHTPQLFPREVVGGVTVVFVDGQVDLAISDRFGRELRGAIDDAIAGGTDRETDGRIDAGPPRLLVDLSNVTFLDSSALGVLVGAYRYAAAVGGDVRLVGPNARIAQLLRLTELDEVLPVHATIESAQGHAARADTGRANGRTI